MNHIVHPPMLTIVRFVLVLLAVQAILLYAVFVPFGVGAALFRHVVGLRGIRRARVTRSA